MTEKMLTPVDGSFDWMLNADFMCVGRALSGSPREPDRVRATAAEIRAAAFRRNAQQIHCHGFSASAG
jgi:hypothetical protein